MLTKAARVPAPSPFDAAIPTLRFLLLTGTPEEDDEMRQYRRRRRRSGDPLAPERLQVRRRERRVELAIRRQGPNWWAARARLIEAEQVQANARRDATRQRREEWEHFLDDNAALLAYYDAMPRERRQVVSRMAWVLATGAWQAPRPTADQVRAQRRAAVAIMREGPIGSGCRYPLVVREAQRDQERLEAVALAARLCGACT